MLENTKRNLHPLRRYCHSRNLVNVSPVPLLRAMGFLYILMLSVSVSASPPTLPLEFIDIEDDPVGILRLTDGTRSLVLGIDEKAVTDVRVSKELFKFGGQTDRITPQPVDIQKRAYDFSDSQGSNRQKQFNAFVVLPLEPYREARQVPLEPGVYAETQIVEGRWAADHQKVRPLIRTERITRFQVNEEGVVKFLTLNEYSALVESVDIGFDKQGNRMLILRGEEGSQKDTDNSIATDDYIKRPGRRRIGEDAERPLRTDRGNTERPMDQTEADED